MRNSETGEYELLVGNRQLLSGFFIVVLLFAVAFSMGYIVGRNSAPSAKAQAEGAPSGAVPSTASENRAQPVSAAPPAANAGPAAGVGGNPAPPSSSGEAEQKPPADAPPQPTTQPERSPQATPAPVVTAPPSAPEAAPGSYWQVIATANQSSADAMLRTLRDQGFPASVSPGPNNLIRVLVGPYNDTQTMGRAKTKLEEAGFHPVRK